MQGVSTSDLGENDDQLKVRATSPYLIWVIWVAWVPFFTPTVMGLFHAHIPLLQLLMSVIGLVLFFSSYLISGWFDARYLAYSSPATSERIPVRIWLTLMFLIVLSVTLILLNGGNDWLGLFYYISGYAGGRLSTVRTLLVVVGLLVLTIVLGMLTHTSVNAIAQSLLITVVIGAIITSLGQVFKTGKKLRMAREEIARLAITAERLRIARDLHDLLGHNLSLITLKSELAGRLIAVQPERAAREVQDIEQVARTTLQEVRDAVSSYRQPGLSRELHAAYEILQAAAIVYRFEGDEEIISLLPPLIESVLSWVVREGVTNVIKHSRAHQCLILLKQEARVVSIEVIDDGIATTVATMNDTGSGLRGLNERVAALGGEVAAAPLPDHGFRLAVSLPLTARKNGGE